MVGWSRTPDSDGWVVYALEGYDVINGRGIGDDDDDDGGGSRHIRAWKCVRVKTVGQYNCYDWTIYPIYFSISIYAKEYIQPTDKKKTRRGFLQK